MIEIEQQRCSNCKFSYTGIFIICRRYPPVNGPTRNEYPEVHTGQWCGEWKDPNEEAYIDYGW